MPETAEPIFFEHEGNRAVRDGEWKLVSAIRARASSCTTKRYEVTSTCTDPEQLLVVSNSSVTASTQAP